MALKKIRKKILRWFACWNPIDEPPKWVWKALTRWVVNYERKKRRSPRELAVIFKGKKYKYKAEFITESTPGPARVYWYKKKRIR